jgi:hypothetical protein
MGTIASQLRAELRFDVLGSATFTDQACRRRPGCASRDVRARGFDDTCGVSIASIPPTRRCVSSRLGDVGERRYNRTQLRLTLRGGHMPGPKPIRYDADTWLVMRSDPVTPKAVVRRVRDKRGNDSYLLLKWDLDPTKQVLMSVCPSLEKADGLVLYDTELPKGYWSGPSNGGR